MISIHIAEQQRTILFSRGSGGGHGDAIYMDMNQTLVLKVSCASDSASYYGTAHREICTYRRLTSAPVEWAPRVICSSILPRGAGIILMTHAGMQVTSANLPADYRNQAYAILTDMRALGIKNNDIVKEYAVAKLVPGRGWSYVEVTKGGTKEGTELRVNTLGNLLLIDFNWATLNNSYNTCAPFTESREIHLPSFIRPRRDEEMLYVLDELALANRSAINESEPQPRSVKELRSSHKHPEDAAVADMAGPCSQGGPHNIMEQLQSMQDKEVIDIAAVKQYKRGQKVDMLATLLKASDALDEDDEGYKEWRATAEMCAVPSVPPSLPFSSQ